MEFSRPEYWSGYPSPSLGDFPNPGIELRSPTLQVDSLPVEPQKTILEWIAYPFSSRSYWPRNWTGSPALQMDFLSTELSGKPSEPSGKTYLIHSSLYISISISEFFLPFPFPHRYPWICALNLCLSFCFTNMFTCNICLYVYKHISDNTIFLPNLLHSIWQFLVLSMSLKMALFHSFLWLSNSSVI